MTIITGAKKQKGAQQRPNIQKDTTASTNFFMGLYGLSEGEIYGLADGAKSIKLDGTPLMNANGQPNFNNVSWEFRTGTLDQAYIKGFGSVNNEHSVGVELRHDRAYTRAINNSALDAVIIRLSWNALREQKDNGDIVGYRIDYTVEVQTDGGAYQEVLRTFIHDKASNGYQRSHRIDLPKARNGWTIRIKRITPNRDSELIADTMSVAALTEVIDAKLRYPHTALLALKYDAETFSNIAKLSVRLKGKLIQVPANYNPETCTYTGLWDGTFKLAYSNNPAWVFYDICTHKRYGLGERLSGKVDKWGLYAIGQYCDDMVDDGQGGKEPRFSCNVYLQKAEDAYQVLQSLASVFRGLTYWNGTHIMVDSDVPKDPVFTFTRANVVNGEFIYSGTRRRDRHSVIKVAWDNPDNDYKTDHELIRDDYAIAKYGISILELNAFGCTSKGQATRVGQWALKSEQLETQTVSFTTGLDGFVPKVGDVINIADDIRAGRAIGGRIVAVNAKQITLDRAAGRVGDTLMVNADGVQQATITALNGTVVTLNRALNVPAGSVWAIGSSDLALQQFRVMSIAHDDDATFNITAIEYQPAKYSDAIRIVPPPISVIKPTALAAPTDVTITSSHRTVQGQSVTTLTINWAQVVGAVAYIVQWRKDDNAWISQKVASQSLDIDGVYGGNYLARVRAVDAFDNESNYGVSTATAITGKTGKPPRLASITAKGGLFSMVLNWVFNVGSGDTSHTEIQVSPNGTANIATLGHFAYPTNKHEITGLQGNLTQFYRARIVDKLGNTSDWTNWVNGTTSADADKVLDLLSGQITQSHLDRTLREPIVKIGGLENAVAGVNGHLGALNQSLSTAQRELNATKTNLQTAVNNITTERNRINSAIRDITALQQDKNAKTQEITNLTQTVNGHTSSIRELGVTTGDLSQKYTQIKTVSDKATSDITAIKQTQAGQATTISRLSSEMNNKASTANLETLRQTLTTADTTLSQQIAALDSAYKKADTDMTARIAREETARANADKANAQAVSNLQSTVNGINGRVGTTESKISLLERTTSDTKQALATAQSQLNARFNNLAVGGRNLLRNSKSRQRQAHNVSHNYETYTLTEPLIVGQSYTFKAKVEFVKGVSDRVTVYDYRGGTAKHLTVLDSHISTTFIATSAEPSSFLVYAGVSGATHNKAINITNAKLERGTIATDWTPAPEDVQTAIDSKASTASLDEFKQAQASKDSATAQKISQIEANLGQKANATALNDLSTRVTQVDGRITAEAKKTSTLQTTVGKHTASIEQHAQSLNGLSAQWTLKVQSGNIVSGIGLASSNGVSDFSVRADKFYIAPPTGTNKGSSPFMVITTPQTINGVQVPAGTYIKSAFIQNGSIDIAKINKASIGSLSALSANIGHFKSAETGARLEIKDSVLLVYDANNRLRVRLGLW